MKIYIAGKVTGLDYNKVSADFAHIAKELEVKGHKPINPLTKCNVKDTWVKAMKKCIKVLCTADAIFMMPNWSLSKGARMELDIANQLQMKIFYNLNDIK